MAAPSSSSPCAVDASADDGDVSIYFEKQEANLCGQHCLNNLVQGSYFSMEALASIATDLDIREREVMAESMGGVDSPHYIRWIQDNQEQNVDASGNFSVQVLSRALQNLGLQLVPYMSQSAAAARDDPTSVQGFVCHLSDHWFAIRKVFGSFFNVNSLKEVPEPVSDFYLTAYLDSLRQKGWSIFIVDGKFPQSNRSMTGPFGRWISMAEVLAASEAARRRGAGGRSAAAAVDPMADPELAAALAASQQDMQDEESRRDDAMLAQVLAMSASAAGINPGASRQLQVHGEAPMDLDNDDDDELARAIAMSMGVDASEASPAEATAEPSASGGSAAALAPRAAVTLAPEPGDGDPCVDLHVKFPDGTAVARRFAPSEPQRAVYDWLRREHPVSFAFTLATRPTPGCPAVSLLGGGGGGGPDGAAEEAALGSVLSGRVALLVKPSS